MDKLSDNTHKIENILSYLLREYGYDRKILEAKVLAAWDSAVGEPVARNTRAISLFNGKLTVYAVNSVLITELSLLKQHVTEKINHTVGKTAVTDLQFFVKPIKPSTRKMQPRQPSKRLNSLEKVVLTPYIMERIDRKVAKVEDTELKACLKRVFMKQSQRAVIDDVQSKSGYISSQNQPNHDTDSPERGRGSS
ncbi:MAG: DUF721 domain-containing protein [Candidatus Poribacteria bacterium]|nr:DUF721 domain-containing protein [Candidatus Poribacteria bacterium]